VIKFKNKTRIGLATILVILLLAGCGPPPEEQAATAAVLTAAAATSTPTITLTPTSTPTPTPLPKPMIGSVLQSDVDGMKMVFIPGGTFLQGSTEEEIDLIFEECKAFYENCNQEPFEVEFPQHEVDLDPFWIDQTEVTIGTYLKCVADGSCLEPAPRGYYAYAGYFDNPEYENYPVIFINWQDASDYCAWAGRRLPTESEWELAARGTEGWQYPWGNSPVRGDLVNYRDINYAGVYNDLLQDDGYNRLAPVGSYPDGASFYGALDMAGNVWEWVSDWYDLYPGGNPNASDLFGQKERVIRGGAWDIFFPELRSPYRYSAEPEESLWRSLGFRCALSHSEDLELVYKDQQINQPQPTLAPMNTVEPQLTSAQEGEVDTPQGECRITSITALPGFGSMFSDDEVPVYAYKAEGFLPGEYVSAELSDLSPDSGSMFSGSVIDLITANGKGQIDGILLWSTGVFIAGTVPSVPDQLNISFEGDNCTLSQDVTWPYLE